MGIVLDSSAKEVVEVGVVGFEVVDDAVCVEVDVFVEVLPPPRESINAAGPGTSFSSGAASVLAVGAEPADIGGGGSRPAGLGNRCTCLRCSPFHTLCNPTSKTDG